MFCSAAKVMENYFDNEESQYKYKWFISTFGEKPAALVNGHELSGKNFDPASSMQFDSSLCSFLYFSSLAVSKVIHGIWIRLHHPMV